MYYTSDEHKTILEQSTRPSAKDLHKKLKQYAQELTTDPESYRLYGPYWWPLKALLRNQGLAGRAWFRGTHMDQRLIEEWDREFGINCDPWTVVCLAREYRSLQDLGIPDSSGQDIPFHLVEYSHGEVELYELCDPDAGRQLDLFEALEDQQEENQAFLDNPGSFIPRTWEQSGDELLSQNRVHCALRHYKRAVLLSRDSRERSALWLRMGLALGEAQHHWKAVFAFTNCYQTGEEAWVMGHIGQAYEELGHWGEAKRCYEAALEHMPGNPELQQAVIRIQTRAGTGSQGTISKDAGSESPDGPKASEPHPDQDDQPWDEDSQVLFGFTG